MLSTRVKAVLLGLVAALVLAGCSSDGSGTPTKPTKDDHSTGSAFGSRLHLTKGSGGIKNVFVKVGKGHRMTFFAPPPGHKVLAQQFSKKAAKKSKGKRKSAQKSAAWTEPVEVFSNDNAYCRAVDAAAAGGTVAVAITCSPSRTDNSSAAASVLAVSSDLTAWKVQPVPVASGAPTVSPSGAYVAESSSTGFMLWSKDNGYKPIAVKHPPGAAAPVGAVDDDGKVVIVRSTQPDKCVVQLLTTSPGSTAQGVFTSKPLTGQPNCEPLSARFSKTDLKVDLVSVTTKKPKGKKRHHHAKPKRTHFSAFFTQGSAGGWSVE